MIFSYGFASAVWSSSPQQCDPFVKQASRWGLRGGLGGAGLGLRSSGIPLLRTNFGGGVQGGLVRGSVGRAGRRVKGLRHVINNDPMVGVCFSMNGCHHHVCGGAF